MNECLCCGSRSLSATSFQDGFISNFLMRCGICGHIQISVLPDDEQLRFYYKNRYSSQRFANFGYRYKRVMMRRAMAQIRYCTNHVSMENARILDIGCGYGALLHLAKNRGIQSAGLEYDPAAVQYGSDNGLVIESIKSEREVVEAINKFAPNLVVMSHVLEHLRDPCQVLESCCKCFIFIEVPAYNFTISEQFIDQEGHLNFFQESTIMRFLARLGIKIVAHGCFGPGMNFFWEHRWNIARKVLRQLSNDYFFWQYSTQRKNGIWVRILGRGKLCKL